ncbi:MAG: hypothetical protein P4L46_23315 [Fimbriimonas sp.]|nr:hypothetical protein [Fimbriimonas sp.]
MQTEGKLTVQDGRLSSGGVADHEHAGSALELLLHRPDSLVNPA